MAPLPLFGRQRVRGCELRLIVQMLKLTESGSVTPLGAERCAAWRDAAHPASQLVVAPAAETAKPIHLPAFLYRPVISQDLTVRCTAAQRRSPECMPILTKESHSLEKSLTSFDAAQVARPAAFGALSFYFVFQLSTLVFQLSTLSASSLVRKRHPLRQVRPI